MTRRRPGYLLGVSYEVVLSAYQNGGIVDIGASATACYGTFGSGSEPNALYTTDYHFAYAIGARMGLILPRGDVVNVDGPPEAEVALQERAIALCSTFRRAVDAHAHVGGRSLRFARQFASVESFEPQDECYECFIQNVDSPRVTLRRIGVYSRSGVGYAPLISGKDSASPSIQIENLKNTIRIPLTAIDDFGWTDVDLIFVSRSADWLEVLAGALGTIKRSLPIICVRPKDQGERGTQIIKKLAPLLALGYRIEEIDDEGLILVAKQAVASAAVTRPPVTMVSSDELPDRHLVVETTDWEPPLSRANQSLIGRTMAPTRSPVLAMTSGIAQFHDLTVKPSFSIEGYSALRLPGGSIVKFDDVEQRDLASLTKDVRLTLSAVGGLVEIPPVLAAIATRLSACLVHDNGRESPIFDKRIEQVRLIDAVEFSWPLNIIKPGKCRVKFRILQTDRIIAEVADEIDLTLHHLHRDTVNCYLNRGGGGNSAMRAMATSLNCRTYYAEDGFQPGVSVVWGVLRGSKAIIDQAADQGSIFYYVDHAYFSRGHGNSYRITRDAFEAGPVRECPDDRFQQFDVKVSRWNKDGRSIIVCPPTDYFMSAHNCHGWLDDTLREIRQHSDRPIVIREKKADVPMTPLAEALADAHALVTHSSNVAIEAAVLGTPVFVSERSAARPIGLSDLSLIETPARPSRKKWLAHLAYSQFSYEEMVSGEVWAMLEEFEQRPFAR